MFDENYLENRQINDVLLIGGGAFHYPKYFLAHHQGNIDVVEINKVLYDISNKYFYLEETINKFDKNKNRFHCYFENGRDYINRNKKKYDALYYCLYFYLFSKWKSIDLWSTNETFRLNHFFKRSSK